MFIQADSVGKNSLIETDICIVGSGAAGLALGMEFLSSRYKVCIIESGTFEQTTKPDDVYRFVSKGLPISHESRTRSFGGTTSLWSGRWKTFDEIDFKVRDWVPNSGWPIEYKEVISYCHKASRLVFCPDMSQDNLDEYDFLKTDVIKPVMFRTQKVADWHWGDKFKHLFEASENIAVYLSGHATKMEKIGQRIDFIQVQTVSGNSFKVTARFFVLAAGGIENPRLLLNSEIGNEHDQVGRYYMDHPKGKEGLIEMFDDVNLLKYSNYDNSGEAQHVGFRLSDEIQKKYKVLNSHIFLEPVLETFVVKRILNKILKSKKTPVIAVRNYMEQVPNPYNRVYLDTKTDVFGGRRAVVDWSIGDLDKKTMFVFHQILRDELQKLKIGELESSLLKPNVDFPINQDASHHMGTTRMGRDVRNSVVDTDCKIHNINNLFVAGSSVFPTSGYANPTLTIVALTIRLADHLKTKL